MPYGKVESRYVEETGTRESKAWLTALEGELVQSLVHARNRQILRAHPFNRRPNSKRFRTRTISKAIQPAIHAEINFILSIISTSLLQKSFLRIAGWIERFWKWSLRIWLLSWGNWLQIQISNPYAKNVIRKEYGMLSWFRDRSWIEKQDIWRIRWENITFFTQILRKRREMKSQ